MGKKSKKTKANAPQKKAKDATIGEDGIARFLDSVEIRPSKIHGEGLFATRRITSGVHRATNMTLTQKASVVLSKSNSVSCPPWRKIMESVVILKSEKFIVDSFDAIDEAKRTLLKEQWLTYVEQAQPNIESDAFKTETGLGQVLTVLSTIECGDEIFRSYGHEWLSMMYFELLGCCEPTAALQDQTDESVWLDLENLRLSRFALEPERTSACRKKGGEELDMVQVGSVEIKVVLDLLKFLADQFRRDDRHLECCWKFNHFLYELRNPTKTNDDPLQTFKSSMEGILKALD